MTRINTNVASLRGLRSLNKSTNLLDTSLTRLSTGLKINSGKDNPSGLIASETLRSQVSAIEQSIKNSNRASNVIATADSALGEVTNLLNQVRGLVQEGLNEGALSQDEIAANQLQIDTALSAINRISANTSFAGDKLIDGSKAFRTQSSAADSAKLSDFQVNEAVFGSSSSITLDATIVTAATQASLDYSAVDGGLAAATTIEVGGSSGSQVLFLGASSTLDNVKDAVNGVTDITGVTATKTNKVASNLTVDSTAANSDLTFTDARTSDSVLGDTGQNIRISFVDPSSNSAAANITFSNTNSDITIVVSLATLANGDISSTATSIKALLDGNADTNSLVSSAVEGDGSGVVDAAAAAALSGGTDAYLTFSANNYGADEFVDVNVLSGTFDTVDNITDGNALKRDIGSDIVARINGQVAQGSGLSANLRSQQLDASFSFTAAANTVDNTASITITGGGSLFQIGQDVSAAGQVGIGIEAVNTARLGGVSGKLFELGSGGGKSLLDVGPSVPGSDLVNIIEEAVNRVSTLRGRLGAIQKNVIETNVSSLGVALENISEARSQIVDTDFAVETANLTKAQILNQAGISVLSIANQNPQQVLSLLR
ncbi:flagellin [Gimesia maris]|uniref:flagellin N-terminal helical domain-containing protein n=1 Tax=Gimesia maris TaxID=122 RepID=UPI00241E9A91|nr:flagellin [Gimesia maris]|tara:strand:- start:10544 stop:12352 length:1809 start_codon:yes stop_codon:yes gene_type:complete